MNPARRCSLVYSLEDALKGDFNLGGPEPDYLKWLDNLLFAEIGNASDEAIYDKNPPEVRNAWKVFGDAVSATHELLELYRKVPALFQKIAGHFSVLPCLMSRHPFAQKFNQELFEQAKIGEESMLCEQARHGRHHAYQSWPIRYAYALITTIHLTLDSYDDRLPLFAMIYGYGNRHRIESEEVEEILAKGRMTDAQKDKVRREYRDAYRILPNWTKGLTRLGRRFNSKSVLDYWKKGKEMLSEEIPDFHLRPEWKSYHARTYRGGAKPGVVQHAIFKDILAAMRTIAGGDFHPAAKKKTKPPKLSSR